MSGDEKTTEESNVENGEAEIGATHPLPSHYLTTEDCRFKETEYKDWKPATHHRFLRRFTTTNPLVVVPAIFVSAITFLIRDVSDIPFKVSMGIFGLLSLCHGIAVVLTREITQFNEAEDYSEETFVGQGAIAFGLVFICLGIFMLSTIWWVWISVMTSSIPPSLPLPLFPGLPVHFEPFICLTA